MPRKKKTETKATNPMDIALRESLHRVLKKNADKWPQEASDLRRWIDREKPNFSNLREAFLADKTPEELATLFPTGQKGLADLQKRHLEAVEAAVAAFPDGYDTEPPPPKVRAREDYLGEYRKAELFSVLPFPAGSEPDLSLVTDEKTAAKLAHICFFPCDEWRPWTLNEQKDVPAEDPERMLWTLAHGQIMFLPHELFPSKSWLDLVAYAWLAEHRERLRAVDIEVRPIAAVGGLQYTTFPRGLEGASAMGGPIAIADPVEVNGEEYANEPALVADAAGKTIQRGEKLKAVEEAGSSLAIQPRSLGVVPEEWLDNAKQMHLELGLDDEHVREYLVETATKTAALAKFTAIAPKMLGFMFACAPMSGRGVKGNLEELALSLIPDLKERRRKQRDLSMVGTALVAMKGLRVLEKKANGVLHPYDLFSLDYDLSSAADAEVGWCINPWLAKRMEGGSGGGFFLLNMSRWLQLPIKNPRIFPLALRLAAYQDKARVNGIYQPNRLQWIEADKLALQCNTLPEEAAAYRDGHTANKNAKVQLSKTRANLEADLDTLKEHGFLGNWRKEKVYGKGWRLLPVPAEDYAEACRNAVNTVKGNRKAKKQAGKKR